MDPLPYQIAAVATAAAVGAAAVAWEQVIVRSRWVRAGWRLGLRASYPWRGVPRLDGDGGLPVTVVGDLARAATITIGGLPPPLRLGPKTTVLSTTGDRRFDAHVSVDDSAFVHALLDEPTRRAVEALIARAGSVIDGELRDSLSSSASMKRIVARTQEAIDLALLLSRDVEIPIELAKISAQDPQSGVREKCLRLLVESFRDAPATMPACRRARKDVAPEVRLVAAVGLGPDGAATFAELVRSEWVTNEIATKAIAYATEKLGLPLAEATLRAAFGHPRASVRAQGIYSASRAGWWEPFPWLMENALRDETVARTALADALARFPEHAEESEPSLVAMLAGDAGMRLAAIRSLGAIGTLAAVEHLLPFGAGGLLDSEEKRAASKAVRQIQGRQSGGEAGQLSVADGDGRISLADDARGELSIAEAEHGNLALVADSGAVSLAPEKKR